MPAQPLRDDYAGLPSSQGPKRGDRRKMARLRPRLALLPVVDCLHRRSHEDGDFGSAEVQTLAMRKEPLGTETLQSGTLVVRRRRNRGGATMTDELLQRLGSPLQLGHLLAIRHRRFADRENFGFDFLACDSGDLALEGGGNVGHLTIVRLLFTAALTGKARLGYFRLYCDAFAKCDTSVNASGRHQRGRVKRKPECLKRLRVSATEGRAACASDTTSGL